MSKDYIYKDLKERSKSLERQQRKAKEDAQSALINAVKVNLQMGGKSNE